MAIAVDAAQNESSPLRVSLLSSREICERSLRKIGAYAINDDGADQEEMDEALYWLDLILAEITETRRCYWLSPATVTFDWPAGEESVVLSDQMGADYPPTGILFPVRAWRIGTTTDPDTDIVTNTSRNELELCRRKKYEDRSGTPTWGDPDILYIDRLNENQRVYVLPVPALQTPPLPVQRIALEFQTYSRSVLGTQGGEQAGNVQHGFSPGWQLFIVTRLAAEIGDGPVKKLPAADIGNWRIVANNSLTELLYSNREKTNRRPVTKRYGG